MGLGINLPIEFKAWWRKRRSHLPGIDTYRRSFPTILPSMGFITRKTEVGPWGWAARIQWENYLLSTATLMGHDFAQWKRYTEWSTAFQEHQEMDELHLYKWVWAFTYLIERGISTGVNSYR